MPRLNGTGPTGEGPMTGRGLGNCNNTDNNYIDKGFSRGLRRGFGRGLGRGSGRGFGFCRWLSPFRYNNIDEKTLLEKEKEALEDRLTYIDKTLNDTK